MELASPHLGELDEHDRALIRAVARNIIERWSGSHPTEVMRANLKQTLTERSTAAAGAMIAIVELVRDVGAGRGLDALIGRLAKNK